MAFFKLESACCCMSLKTGTLILGWLSLVSRALILLYVIGLAFDLTDYFIEFSTRREYTSVVVGVSIVMVGCALSYMALSITFLYGVYKKRPHFMIPILGETFMGLVPVPAMLIGSLALLPISLPIGFGILILGVIYFAFGVYCLRIMWSYYEVLRMEVAANTTGHTAELAEPEKGGVYLSKPHFKICPPPLYSVSYERF